MRLRDWVPQRIRSRVASTIVPALACRAPTLIMDFARTQGEARLGWHMRYSRSVHPKLLGRDRRHFRFALELQVGAD